VGHAACGMGMPLPHCVYKKKEKGLVRLSPEEAKSSFATARRWRLRPAVRILVPHMPFRPLFIPCGDGPVVLATCCVFMHRWCVPAFLLYAALSTLGFMLAGA